MQTEYDLCEVCDKPVPADTLRLTLDHRDGQCKLYMCVTCRRENQQLLEKKVAEYDKGD